VVIEPSHISALPKNDVPTLNGVLTVRTVDGMPFRILAVNGVAPAFVDYNPAVDEPRPMYRITWDVGEFNPRTCVNSAGKKMPGWYLIEIDRPDAPVLDVEVRSMCTMRQLPAPGQYWLMSQKSAMIGRLKAGQSTEFTLGMKWKPGVPVDDLIRDVRSESPDIDVQLVEVREEGDTIDVVVNVTAKGNHRGALYAPIRFYSSRHECPVVVLGQIVD
jgi:hypothetical protein